FLGFVRIEARASGPGTGVRVEVGVVVVHGFVHRLHPVDDIPAAAGLDQPPQRAAPEWPSGGGYLNPAAARLLGSSIPPPPTAIAAHPVLGRIEVVQPV